MSIDLSRALPYLSPIRSIEETAPVRRFGSMDRPIARAFTKTLIVTYMVDEPGALVFVRQRDLEKRQHTELHERAIRNLRAQTTQRTVRSEQDGATRIVHFDGQHDASLLLLDELWDPPARIVEPEGELVVAIPSHAKLLVTGTATAGGITELLDAVSTPEHPLTSELLVRRAGVWTSYAS